MNKILRNSLAPRLLILAVVLSLAVVPAVPVGAQPSVAVIESLSTADDATGTTLTVRTSEEVAWTAGWLPSGNLLVTLPKSVLGNSVVHLAPDEGLIASVKVLTAQIEDLPATALEISLRSPASIFPVAGPNRIDLTFRPRRPEPIDPEPVQPEQRSVEEVSGEYRIGPGDLLEISVFGLDDFDRTVRVLRDGSISLPLLGGLRVLGMTLEDAQTRVAGLLTERRLVNNPQVTFFVKEYVSRGVSVQGAVVKPGIYQMIQQRTLLEMLGEAGGLSGNESARAGQQIFVIRKAADGEQTRIEVDADQLVNQGRADLNIPLFPDDVILVPFAQKHRVYVSGAVVRPGPVEFLSSEGITVLQAITAAGGPSERGNLGGVKIARRKPDGTEERIAVNVKKIRKGKQEDLRLQRNDTVIVGEWFF